MIKEFADTLKISIIALASLLLLSCGGDSGGKSVLPSAAMPATGLEAKPNMDKVADGDHDESNALPDPAAVAEQLIAEEIADESQKPENASEAEAGPIVDDEEDAEQTESPSYAEFEEEDVAGPQAEFSPDHNTSDQEPDQHIEDFEPHQPDPQPVAEPIEEAPLRPEFHETDEHQVREPPPHMDRIQSLADGAVAFVARLPDQVEVPNPETWEPNAPTPTAPVFADERAKLDLRSLLDELYSHLALNDSAAAVDLLENRLIPRINGCQTGTRHDDAIAYCPMQYGLFQRLTTILWLLDGTNVSAESGGVVNISFSPAALVVPPGALNEDTIINVAPTYYLDLPQDQPPGVYYEKAVQFLPHGLQFNKPVQAKFPLQRRRPAGYAFTVFYYQEAAGAWIDAGQVAIVDPDGTTATTVLHHFSYYLLGHPVNPDADRIVFHATESAGPAGEPSDIIVMELPDGVPVNLTFDLAAQELYPRQNRDKIVFASSYPDHVKFKIFMMNIDGTGLEQVSADDGLGGAWNSDISRNGDMVVFSSDKHVRYRYNIHIATRLAPGVWQEETITSGSSFMYPSFSYDETEPTIVFNNNNEIWVMNSDGSGARYLGVRGSHPVFSPDGGKIAFHAADSSWRVRIYAYDIASKTVEQFTWGNYNSVAPGFSPDSSRIVFQSHRPDFGRASDEIWEVNLATGELNLEPVVPCADYLDSNGYAVDCGNPDWWGRIPEVTGVEICFEDQFSAGPFPSCSPENKEALYGVDFGLRAVCLYDDGSRKECADQVEWTVKGIDVGEVILINKEPVFITDVADRAGDYPQIGKAGAALIQGKIRDHGSRELSVRIAYASVAVSQHEITNCPVEVSSIVAHPRGVEMVGFNVYHDNAWRQVQEVSPAPFGAYWDCTAVDDQQGIETGVDIQTGDAEFIAEAAALDGLILIKAEMGRIAAPISGSTITQCPTLIEAEAQHRDGVEEVLFEVMHDGAWHELGADGSPPYGIDWDCSSVSDQEGIRVRVALRVESDSGVEGFGRWFAVASEIKLETTPLLERIDACFIEDYADAPEPHCREPRNDFLEMTYGDSMELAGVCRFSNGNSVLCTDEVEWTARDKGASTEYIGQMIRDEFVTEVSARGVGFSPYGAVGTAQVWARFQDVQSETIEILVKPAAILQPRADSTIETCPVRIAAEPRYPPTVEKARFFVVDADGAHYLGEDLTAPYEMYWDCTGVEDQGGVQIGVDFKFAGLGWITGDVVGDLELKKTPIGYFITPAQGSVIIECPARIEVVVHHPDGLFEVAVEANFNGAWHSWSYYNSGSHAFDWNCANVPNQEGITFRAYATIFTRSGAYGIAKYFAVSEDVSLAVPGR